MVSGSSISSMINSLLVTSLIILISYMANSCSCFICSSEHLLFTSLVFGNFSWARKDWFFDVTLMCFLRGADEK
jgi:hypothetical protein